jgi:hypothetical protein
MIISELAVWHLVFRYHCIAHLHSLSMPSGEREMGLLDEIKTARRDLSIFSFPRLSAPRLLRPGGEACLARMSIQGELLRPSLCRQQPD